MSFWVMLPIQIKSTKQRNASTLFGPSTNSWVSLKADGPPDPASAGDISDNMQMLAESPLMELIACPIALHGYQMYAI